MLLGLLHGDEAVVHPEWSKDVLLDVRPVGLSRDGLHNESEHDVADVRVFEGGADGSIKCDGAHVAHKLLDRPSSCYCFEIHWESARHVQELADSDACRGCGIGEAKPGQ